MRACCDRTAFLSDVPMGNSLIKVEMIHPMGMIISDIDQRVSHSILIPQLGVVPMGNTLKRESYLLEHLQMLEFFCPPSLT